MYDIVDLKLNSSAIPIDLAVEWSDTDHLVDHLLFCKGHQKFRPQFGAESGKYVRGNYRSMERLRTQALRSMEADRVKKLEVFITEDIDIAVNGEF